MIKNYRNSALKDVIKKVLFYSPVPVTKNMEYDKLTKRLIRTVCSETSNCLDIGSHEGEILELFLKYAPKGEHEAFEPLPSYHRVLADKFNGRARIHPHALSDKKGNSSFHHVMSDPAYSGLKERDLKGTGQETEWIEVEQTLLDEVLAPEKPIDLIKIDVEGGEYHVLKGAERTLSKWHPTIVFEHGMGAADHYGVAPKDLHHFLKDLGYRIFTLKGFFRSGSPLDPEEFTDIFNSGKEWYFVATA